MILRGLFEDNFCLLMTMKMIKKFLIDESNKIIAKLLRANVRRTKKNQKNM